MAGSPREPAEPETPTLGETVPLLLLSVRCASAADHNAGGGAIQALAANEHGSRFFVQRDCDGDANSGFH